MTITPSNPLVSDTGEIIKDIKRKQLTVSAPQAEAFSGFLDGQPPAGINHLHLLGNNGFATIIMVSVDGKDFGKSEKILISRTGLDANHQEINGPMITLKHLQAPTKKNAWYIKRTRSGVQSKYERLETCLSGEILLPRDSWREIELTYGKPDDIKKTDDRNQVGWSDSDS
ncbi:hypothetical protein ACFQ88_24275 [Paenibacillus sp. NPDC056579]|uniref:hypothetical protein n=1 Tax=Paenibacillus sp. NPDC056579 TaxID=3345871 RepID=UPI0036993918